MESEYRDCVVVVVDDNDSLRQLLSVALETAGFVVIEAGTQLELQRHLARVRPDALVLNLQRSKAEGLNLLMRMRARRNLHGVPILFLTGSGDDAFRDQAMRAGADWFGLRPLGMIELQTQLGELIRTVRLRRYSRASLARR